MKLKELKGVEKLPILFLSSHFNSLVVSIKMPQTEN